MITVTVNRLERIKKKALKIIAEQEGSVGVEKSVVVDEYNRIPVSVEINNRENRLALLVAAVAISFFSLALIAIILSAIWRAPTTALPSQASTLPVSTTYATKAEVSLVEEKLDKSIASARNDLDTVATKNDLRQAKEELVKRFNASIENSAAGIRQEITAAQPKKLAEVETIQYVNILFLNEYGRVVECFKHVHVKDVAHWERIFSARPFETNGIHFMFEGKPVDWSQKVVCSSVLYTENGQPMITGAIVYTPSAGEAAVVINVAPTNVYIDENGSIWYEDNECFPRAPKGAGYITTQSTLPTQP